MTHYFAYGSNMNRAMMRRHCPGAKAIGPAMLRGCRFIITIDGYGSIVPSRGGIVHGVLWRLTPRDVAGRIVALPEENRAALLFGSERYGLATEDLNHCNVLVRIPANPEYCSLNLAMSVQLAAYELFIAREQPHSHTQLEMALAPSGDVEHFYSHLLEVLKEIDFDDRTGHLMERLRRLFNRAQLDRNELNILRGILSAVQGRRGQSAQRSK